MDSEKFIAHVLPLRDIIFRIVKRLCCSAHHAEDLTQDVLLKLWDKKAQLSEVNNLEAFVIKAARNHFLDKQKSSAKMKTAHMSAQFEVVDQSHHSVGSSDLMRIEEVINALPEQQKTVMHLRDVEGLELCDIAYIVGITENNVRVTLSRARTTVKNNLVKMYNYGISRD